MWAALRPLLKGLDPVRIESPMTLGVPDVNYTFGWIELKYKEKWPARGGPLKLEHYTKEQKIWAVRRAKAGGRIFLLLKVGAMEWLLFRGEVAAEVLGKLSREELYRNVEARWVRAPKAAELLTHLCNSPTVKRSSFGVVGPDSTSSPPPLTFKSTLTSSGLGKKTRKLRPAVKSPLSLPKSAATSPAVERV